MKMPLSTSLKCVGLKPTGLMSISEGPLQALILPKIELVDKCRHSFNKAEILYVVISKSKGMFLKYVEIILMQRYFGHRLLAADLVARREIPQKETLS